MDVRNWKKVLLQWVTECGFVEGHYFSLEQTDIDEFYKKFRAKHRIAQKNEAKSCLRSFLKEHYAEFNPHMDDQNLLSANEYIYVYSLLLHFACVKNPEANFHEICKRLPGSSQLAIASFFNELITCKAIDRDKLRHAIATIAVKNGSPGSDPHSSNNSSGSNSTNNAATSTSGGARSLDSPGRKLCYSPANRSPRPNQGTVPPTPKSAMLEERTRELFNLRAQLETERYEKGMLEVQIRQNEEKMKMLNQDHKKLQQQIQNLKNDILVKSSEESSPNRSDDEQMKKRLCLEISQKEAEITKLNELIENLKEEKSLVHEKLLYANKNIDVCMLRIKELDYKVDELTVELEQKESTIKFLSDSKLELEQFIAETRASNNNAARLEYMDASFSPLTDNSGSNSSPENLGRSVVDVQLREKEQENTLLREELTNLHENNRQMSEVIQKFTIKHSQEFNLTTAIGSLVAKQEEVGEVSPFQYLVHLMEYVDRLGLNYKDEKIKLKNYSAEIQAKQRRNDELGKKLLEFEKEVGFLREHIKGVEVMNTELEQSKKRIQEKVKHCEQEIVKINEQKFELVAKLESLANDYDSYKHKCSVQRQDYTTQIKKLEDEVIKREKDNVSMRVANEQLSSEVNTLQNKIKALQQSMLNSTDEVKTLADRLKTYKNELQTSEQTEKAVKDKYEKLLVQHEAIKRDRRETADHLEAMRNNIAVKEFEMGKIGAEIVEVRKKNVELELRIDTLMTDFKNEKHNSDVAINTRDEHIRRISEERDNMEEALRKLQKDYDQSKIDLVHSKEEFNAAMATFDAMNIMLCGEKCGAAVDLMSKLAEVVGNVKQLQENKRDMEGKMELLNFNHTESATHTQELEIELKSVKQSKEEVESKLKQRLEATEKKLYCTQKELKLYEDRFAALKTTLEQVAEEAQTMLKINDDEHTRSIKEARIEHERTLKLLEQDLNSSKELIVKKDHELHKLVEESVGVKKRLDDSVHRLEQVQKEYTQMRKQADVKLKQFEEKINVLANENERLIDEIDVFKDVYMKTGAKLKEADTAITELSGQLLEEVASKSEMGVKLEESEIRLSETEHKLENLLKEKSHTISGLKTAYESQTAVLKRAEGQVSALEKLKLKQSQTIATLQQNLKKITEEKDRLARDVSSFTSQIQREQEEKSVLLSSLEQTADQLKLAVCEKDQQVHVLEKNCTDLHSQIRAANELCAKLQTELTAKDTQLSRLMEEQEHERDNWQTKLSEMMRMLAEHSVEMETNDVALVNIISVVENHINLSFEVADREEGESAFKVEEREAETNTGKLKMTLNRLLRSISQLHTQLDQTEQKRQGAIEVLEKANDRLNQQLMLRKAEVSELRHQLTSEQKQIDLADDLRKETNALKILNAKLEALLQQTEREIAVVREQHQSALGTIKRLGEEKQELKCELHRANENVSRLIESSDSLRKAKDVLSEEILTMRKQLEQTNEYRIIAESKLQTLTEKSQMLESKLTSSENELSSLRQNMQTLESKKDELIAENKKLLETHEANKKRIEKMAIKLGDTQARCSKVEHENEKLQRKIETCDNEVCTLKERLLSAESSQEQLSGKLRQLEETSAALKKEKQELEAAELDAKAKVTKLEKIRQSNEEKIRKLNHSLEATESANVRLNHEIGDINSQLNEVKNSLSAELSKQLEEIVRQRDDALAHASDLESLNSKRQADAEELREQKSNLSDQLSKMSLSLQISQEKCEKLSGQMRDLEIDLFALKEQKVQLENEHMNTCAKLKEYESHYTQQLMEKEENVVTLESQVEQLKCDLSAKTEEVSILQKERQSLREGNDMETVEIESLRRRLTVAEAVADSEQKASSQLRLDNQILQAKYRESKQRLMEATLVGEERIKENRLEMEGKLDKMKNKMKTLYTEEITKMKGKQERELVTIKSEMDVLKAQNTKYEEHTRKLSSQIVRLNDRILEQQKQNAILSTNLKLLQDRGGTQFKRPSSVMSLPASASSRTLIPSAPNGSNLAMEDEEGEIFNNTYLTDLQTGRMSMCRDVCAEELQYRNSLLPPHLKSTYAAQYDNGLPEDELKDGPHSLDDSMSALLSTTTGGTRKKLTGFTSYKRPGPPTPSKHGGRLSLGGSTEPPREILKESNDGGGGGSSVGTTKTPVRFGFFSSRFSMGNCNSRDESIAADLLKAVQRKNFQSMCVAAAASAANAGAVCTSTPRKSRSHYDQRRLFDQFMTTLPRASMLSVRMEKSVNTIHDSNFARRTPVLCLADVSAIGGGRALPAPAHLKMLEQQRVTRKKRSSLLRQRISRRLKETPPALNTTTTPETPCNGAAGAAAVAVGAGATFIASDATTTTTATTTTASSGDALVRNSGGGGGLYRQRRRQRRDRGPRLSLYASGGNNAPGRTPYRANVREQMRKKAHRQRLEHFNMARSLQAHLRAEGGGCESASDAPRDSEDLHDWTGDDYAHNQLLSETVVLSQNREQTMKCENSDCTAIVTDVPAEAFKSTGEVTAKTAEAGESALSLALASNPAVHDSTGVKDNIAQSDYSNDSNSAHCSMSDSCGSADYNANADSSNGANSFVDGSESVEPLNPVITMPYMEFTPNTDIVSRFNQRSSRFEQLLTETESCAPFDVQNIRFSATISPINAACRHSAIFTLVSAQSVVKQLATPCQDQPEERTMFLFKDAEDSEINLEHLTLPDAFRLWLDIWTRLGQQMRLTISLAVFMPILAIFIILFSHYP